MLRLDRWPWCLVLCHTVRKVLFWLAVYLSTQCNNGYPLSDVAGMRRWDV